ncbi:MAG TPA: anti-sigma factor [Pyrinomonadaceae bacterium]|nr:anti-sigma factor [Pyrinomonadaceae bacterium]
MEHQDYQELLVPHSLDALEVSEARELEAHLETCAECRAELLALRDDAALLAYTAVPAEPRPQVRAGILESVRAEQSVDRAGAVNNKVVPLRPRANWNIWTMGLRVAAGLAFVALLIGLVVLWRREVKLRQEIALLNHQLDFKQHELVRDRDVLAREREALTVLTSPNAKRLDMAGTQTAQNARGSFVYDQKSGRAVFLAEGLPATPGDKAYELWFIPKGHSPVPGRIFTVDSSGRALLPQQMPADAMENGVIAITQEPKSGSAVPTGAIYLSSPKS